ncbi:hypothetical protein LZ554_004359 [Drepanopeziza brunnea f. sp. 'monogermtubi']|nr:hypothetical protein LZ554_004359 [Drepanopeziza brunnea f. sp. 'monogermtubi']
MALVTFVAIAISRLLAILLELTISTAPTTSRAIHITTKDKTRIQTTGIEAEMEDEGTDKEGMDRMDPRKDSGISFLETQDEEVDPQVDLDTVVGMPKATNSSKDEPKSTISKGDMPLEATRATLIRTMAIPTSLLATLKAPTTLLALTSFVAVAATSHRRPS